MSVSMRGGEEGERETRVEQEATMKHPRTGFSHLELLGPLQWVEFKLVIHIISNKSEKLKVIY